MWEIVTSLTFFKFLANLEQFQTWIPEAWSVKLTLSLEVIAYLTKIENRIKKSHTRFSALVLLL